MEVEQPAEGILKQNDWGDTKIYRVMCQCGCNNDHYLTVEADDVTVWSRISVKVKSDWWSEAWPKRYDIKNDLLQALEWRVKDIVNGLVTRIKLTWTVWAKGYIESEQEISMTPQQALNYAKCLEHAIIDVETFRKQRQEKRDAK